MDVQRRDDRFLDKIAELILERDTAREQLAAERVAHRVTKRELLETAGMVLSE